MQTQLPYWLALKAADGIGPRLAMQLIAALGSPENVVKSTPKTLIKHFNIGEERAHALQWKFLEPKVNQALEDAQKHKYSILCIEDAMYPFRLKHCIDAPLILFTKGNCQTSYDRVLSIVGTRHLSSYGESLMEMLFDQLKNWSNTLIVSGMAAGIDALAHKGALKHQLPTIGVVAHGFSTMFPAAHRGLAQDMLANNGGLMTEHFYEVKADKVNFPARNRIVAGLADVTIVVESRVKGGSMITAQFANNYNREVMTFPGRIHDQRSEGCHFLVKHQLAHLIESADDIERVMGWAQQKQKMPAAKQLALIISKEAQMVFDVLQNQVDALHIDQLVLQTGLSYTGLSSALLELELEGLLKNLPGKFYRLK